MKVLVTGATGFIGNYVVPELIRHGCDVVATSLNEPKAKELPWFHDTVYIPFDLATVVPDIDYYQFFGRPDKMIHLAWEGLPNYKSAFHQEINLPRHFAFLSNLIHHGLRDLTVTGTCFEYGMQEGKLEETMLSQPQNPYGIAKNTLRMQLEQLMRQTPFNLKWARLFYMYGKGQNSNSLLSQLDKALAAQEPFFNMSGGEQVRDFLPVKEVAQNMVRITLQQKVTGIINCCSGHPVAVKEFVESYLAGKKQNIRLNLGFYPYPDYEPMKFWGDPAKLQSIPDRA